MNTTLIIIGVLLVAGAVGWYFYRKNQKKVDAAITKGIAHVDFTPQQVEAAINKPEVQQAINTAVDALKDISEAVDTATKPASKRSAAKPKVMTTRKTPAKK